MTTAMLASLSRRRRLMAFAAGVLRFHITSRDRPGIERMCKLIDAVICASDAEVEAQTPRLAGLLQAETGMLGTRGEA